MRVARSSASARGDALAAAMLLAAGAHGDDGERVAAASSPLLRGHPDDGAVLAHAVRAGRDDAVALHEPGRHGLDVGVVIEVHHACDAALRAPQRGLADDLLEPVRHAALLRLALRGRTRGRAAVPGGAD